MEVPMALALLVLMLILAALAWWTRADARAYRAFCETEDSALRRAFYWRWTWTSFLGFGLGGAALVLAFTGSLDALWRMPDAFAALRPATTPPEGVDTGGAGYLTGMLIGAGLALGVAALLWVRRIRRMTTPIVVGDIEPLLPRNAREIAAALPLAINAGIAEELFFRLALPLLATRATGSPLAGFLLAGAAFGLAHWYQGWKGVLVVTAVGGWLSWQYLASGSLLKVMLIHALIDLVALVLRPAIALRMRQPAAA
jgi:membrane protease YdiL (CAAX protease family)